MIFLLVSVNGRWNLVCVLVGPRVQTDSVVAAGMGFSAYYMLSLCKDSGIQACQINWSG